jgi:hypothetical protein
MPSHCDCDHELEQRSAPVRAGGQAATGAAAAIARQRRFSTVARSLPARSGDAGQPGPPQRPAPDRDPQAAANALAGASLARAVAVRRQGHVAQSSHRLLQRARFNVGRLRINVDYGGVYASTDFAADIETRFATFTGTALPATLRSAITGLSPAARRWVLYGVSLLQLNAASAPGLDRVAAIQRLVARAPNASSSLGVGGTGFEFEREALRVSGWFEVALAAGLHAPTGTALTTITGLYNPPTAGGGSLSAALDVPLLEADLPPALTTWLNARDPASWTSVGTVSLGTLQTIADEIQTEARTFFAPYADAAMDTPYGRGWRYSSQLFNVTATTPTPAERSAYLLNRAKIVGARSGPGGTNSIFTRTNFESPRDDAELLRIVTAMMTTTPAIAGVVDRLLQHTGRLERPSLRVGISTEWNLVTTSECENRWKNITTLCHELGHALVHPSFPQRANSIRFGQILEEGFTEVLGVQLATHLQAKAASNASFKSRMEAGVAGAPCPAPAALTVGYGQAGTSAKAIRDNPAVGDDNFRAAYFLGAVHLVGL